MIFGKEIEILNEMVEKKLISASDLHLAEFLLPLEENLSQQDEKNVFAVEFSNAPKSYYKEDMFITLFITLSQKEGKIT